MEAAADHEATQGGYQMLMHSQLLNAMPQAVRTFGMSVLPGKAPDS